MLVIGPLNKVMSTERSRGNPASFVLMTSFIFEGHCCGVPKTARLSDEGEIQKSFHVIMFSLSPFKNGYGICSINTFIKYVKIQFLLRLIRIIQIPKLKHCSLDFKLAAKHKLTTWEYVSLLRSFRSKFCQTTYFLIFSVPTSRAIRSCVLLQSHRAGVIENPNFKFGK